MSEEPRAVVLRLKDTVQLVGANTLLARSNQVHRLRAFVQGDMRRLEYRADPNRKLLPATRLIAFPEAKPDLAALTLDAFEPASAANSAAFRANNAVFPDQFLAAPIIGIVSTTIAAPGRPLAFFLPNRALPDIRCGRFQSLC
jgi:hypothetical protein